MNETNPQFTVREYEGRNLAKSGENIFEAGSALIPDASDLPQ